MDSARLALLPTALSGSTDKGLGSWKYSRCFFDHGEVMASQCMTNKAHAVRW